MIIPTEVLEEVKRREAEYYLGHVSDHAHDYKDGFLACWEWACKEFVPRTELDKLQALVDHWYAKANGEKV